MASYNQELLTPIRTYAVTNDDVIKEGDYGKYYIYLRHNLNIDTLLVQWYDDNGNIRSHTGNIKVIDANTVLVYTGGEITGDHKINIIQDKSNVLKGRRLFNQPVISSSEIDQTYRFAIGRPGFPTKNITLDSFSNAMAEILGTEYLKVDNNLSEIVDSGAAAQAQARENLDVYSIQEIDDTYMRKDDPDNLSTLSQYVPGWYQNISNPEDKIILTYGLAQRLEHTDVFTPMESSALPPWQIVSSNVHVSLLSKTIRFNFNLKLSASSEYNYTEIGYVEWGDLTSKWSDNYDNMFIFAVEGMPLINVGPGTTLNTPASTSHMQVKLNKSDKRLEFYALNTLICPVDINYAFQGTLIIP